ncbi:hypothetical protein RO3G_14948 [Rhizopus delemar RA 99-880]|uniref:Uncharacterized protein n=1 Tax=Rhizopus delemar (strain RA 99-880 / ATCC MYA-4621 / FGSC 9543 / NRRL 43880) TaxID=246409 RepID=I1CP57_RHIO9|nr:hypothetical protein RO3G_14948 [Rhizopus delemar RA 99-880]|eukprot:EIE90237.1 hypothetical protein RO3G_14948 [Rhizopus delemar RA 99-880]
MSEVQMDKSKNKSIGRISRLFQKKPKSKTSITSSISSLSISDPILSKQPSFQSISSAQLSIAEKPPRNSSLDSKNLPSLPAHQENDNVSVITIETETSLSLKSNSTDRQQHVEQHQTTLKELEAEKAYYKHENKRLEEQVSKMQAKVKKRTEELKTLEDNYQAHLRSLRCSDDDPKSIARQLIDLRGDIKRLAQELLPFAEPKTTTEKLSTLWLNLGETIGQLGNPHLSPERILLLTEKFMMDVLVQNLNTHHFPGLSCHAEFLEIQHWFEKYDASPFFATRLRQEVSLLIAKNKMSEKEVEKGWKKSAERNWHHLYRGLQKSYPNSFLVSAEEEDQALLRTEYSQRLRQLVEKVMDLGSAIRGQEVCITAMDVKEGVQQFDPSIMEDEDGQTEGTIALCVSPPFVVKLSDHYEPLVKGRVLCFPTLHKEDTNPIDVFNALFILLLIHTDLLACLPCKCSHFTCNKNYQCQGCAIKSTTNDGLDDKTKPRPTKKACIDDNSISSSSSINGSNEDLFIYLLEPTSSPAMTIEYNDSKVSLLNDGMSTVNKMNPEDQFYLIAADPKDAL